MGAPTARDQQVASQGPAFAALAPFRSCSLVVVIFGGPVMRRTFQGALLFTALSAVPAVVCAQTTATVNGTVSDPSDAMIPGATIVLSNARPVFVSR